jgi:hypothetical protein
MAVASITALAEDQLGTATTAESGRSHDLEAMEPLALLLMVALH